MCCWPCTLLCVLRWLCVFWMLEARFACGDTAAGPAQWEVLPWWDGEPGGRPERPSLHMVNADIFFATWTFQPRRTLWNRDSAPMEITGAELGGYGTSCCASSFPPLPVLRHGSSQSKTSSESMSPGATSTEAEPTERHGDTVQAPCVCWSHPCVTSWRIRVLWRRNWAHVQILWVTFLEFATAPWYLECFWCCKGQ